MIFEGENFVICNNSDIREELKNFLKVDFEINTLKIIIFDEYLCEGRCNKNDYNLLSYYLKEIYGANLNALIFTSEKEYNYVKNIENNIQIRSFGYLGIYGKEDDKFLHDRYLLILDKNEKRLLKFFHLGYSLLEILKFIFDDNHISKKFSICNIHNIKDYLKILLCESGWKFEILLEKLME